MSIVMETYRFFEIARRRDNYGVAQNNLCESKFFLFYFHFPPSVVAIRGDRDIFSRSEGKIAQHMTG